MTPVHHQNPQHQAFFPTPNDIDDLDASAARHYLGLALKHITYQSDKITSLETQLLCCAQYVNAAHRKLYQKEHRKERTKLEQLAAGGRRLMTADEWVGALEDEEKEKSTKEKLTAEYNEWKESEKRERKAQQKAVRRAVSTLICFWRRCSSRSSRSRSRSSFALAEPGPR